MTHSKRIVFEVIGGILCVSVGIFGSSMIKTEGKITPGIINMKPAKYESEKIAVVNLDAGVEKKNDTIYYAKNIVELPDENYIMTSLEQAKKGVKSGTYAAYIIIPSTFSASIESINKTPKQAVFQYKIANGLSAETENKIITQLNAFEKNINANVSYIFVDAILRDVHSLQNSASKIMTNDEKDLTTMKNISAEKLIQPVTFSKLKEQESPNGPVDFSSEEQNMQKAVTAIQNAFSEGIKQGQLSYSALAKNDTLVMDGLDALKKQADTANPLEDENKNSYSVAALQRLNEKIKAFNTENMTEEKRNLVKESISSEISTFAKTQQKEMDKQAETIQQDVDAMVSTMKEDIQTYLKEENTSIAEKLKAQEEEDNQKIEEYVKQIQNYLNREIVSDEVKEIIQDVVAEQLKRQETEYGKYIENQKEIAEANGYNEAIDTAKGQMEESEKQLGELQEIVASMKESEEGDSVKATLEEKINKIKESLAKGKGLEKRPVPEAMEKPEVADSFALTDNIREQLQKLVDLSNATMEPGKEENEDSEGKPKKIEIPTVQWSLEELVYTSPEESSKYTVPTYQLPESTQLADSSIEKIEKNYEIPENHFDSVIKENLIDLISARNGQLRSALEKGVQDVKTVAQEYLTGIKEFDPYSSIEQDKVSDGETKLSNVLRDVSKKMTDQSVSSIEYMTTMLQKANENISTLQTDMTNANEKTKANVISEIAAMQRIRTDSSKINLELLKGFAGKLAFTRVGELPNKKVYRFITNPVRCEEDDK